MKNKEKQIAVFGGGCFWCTEAVFQDLKGVEAVISGYAGGKSASPTYEEVSTGSSGHAEVIKVEYDPNTISFGDLLMVFFESHDPTTLNRQGNDVGTQYRSIILYSSDEQKSETETFIKELNSSGKYKNEVVTEIVELKNFYPAEEYHRRYYQQNPSQAYCQIVISPKLEKLNKNRKYSKLKE